jgi:mannose-P-dolichol utilization defect protein 1
MYINTAAQGIHKGVPFSVWGENAIIFVQMVVIIGMIWMFSFGIKFFEKLAVIIVVGGWATFVLNDQGVSEDVWIMISSSTGLIIIASRVPQIMTNFYNKSTGQLAFVSFCLSFAGCVARLGTVLFETDDIYFQAQFFLSTALNGIIVLQFVLYWNSADQVKKVEETEKSKKAKANKLD